MAHMNINHANNGSRGINNTMMNNNNSIDTYSNNILKPTSLGAFLTEEIMIQPYSMLPSFIEMAMIEDTSISINSAIKTLIQNVLLDHVNHEAIRLRRILNAINHYNNSNNPNNNGRNNQNQSQQPMQRSYRNRIAGVLRTWIYVWKLRIYEKLDIILNQYSAELRCILLYCIERHCLHSTATARLGEIIYGTKRVKKIRQQQDNNHASNEMTNNDNTPASNGQINGNKATQPTTKGADIYTLVPLSNVDKTRLALLVSFASYIRERMDRLHQNWKYMDDDTEIDTTLQDACQQQQRSHLPLWCNVATLRRLFVKLYPSVLCSIDCVSIWCQFQFLIGRSLHYDIPSLLLGQIVRRVTLDDTKIEKKKLSLKGSDVRNATKANESVIKNSKTQQQTNTISSQTSSVMHNIPPETNILQSFQKPIMFVASTMFVLSCIANIRSEWLEYSQQQRIRRRRQRRNRNREDDVDGDDDSIWDIPPPPIKSNQYSGTRSVVDGSVLCPICSRPLVHPTASSSGNVFCLSCIKSYVKEHNACPVTGVNCAESNLVRLYEPVSQHTTVQQ